MLRSLLFVVAAALPLSAQQTLTESIEVRVVTVDAVVTDRDGKPVPGLTAADFEILENGRPQTITNFFEVRSGEAVPSREGAERETAPAPARRFILFVDNDSLHPYNRKLLIDALRKFVETELRPGDLASVVAWNRELTIAAPFTDDRKTLVAAIDRIGQQSSAGRLKTDLSRVQKDCVRALDGSRTGAYPPIVAYEQCIASAKEETMVTALLSRQLLNAIELTMTTVAGAEGKKIFVLAGARLPRSPGREIFQWANQLFMHYLTGFDAPLRQPEQDDEQLEFLEKVAGAANAHGVTLHTIAATTSSDVSTPDYQHAVDDRGADFHNQANTFDSFAVLTGMTGGTSINRPINYADALAAIADESESYYSLGYRPRETTGGDRALTVRAKNREYKVRARVSHALKTADEVMSDKTVANLYTAAPSRAWNPRIVAGTVERAGKNFKVPFEVTIPASGLTLLPAGDEIAGGYTVYVAVGTPQGALSTVFRQPEAIRIPARDEKAFRREALTFGATLTIRPGQNILSVGVVDHVSGEQAFARTTVVAK
ncbi:MAG TPA: VWA domain-containing protein [Thermoanaerobaculia bacterium]|nr:VWA domain-containing protein [Thermoanaerobaculia bacterium]